MAYADLAAVKARAGVLANAWTATSTPSNTDVSGFVDDVAAEIDALISARGLTPPLAGSAAAKGLKGMNADGALVLALEASYPEGSGLGSAGDILTLARDRYEAMMAELLAGTLPALALLEATSAAAPSESSFWQREENFGEPGTSDARDVHPFTSAGPIGRGQRF